MYIGLMIAAPAAHLCFNVHEVSLGNLSVVTLTSTTVPEVHVVMEVVGLKLGLPVLDG